MASTVARNSYKHAFLVSECNNLFLKLPPGEYTFHDMGLKVNVNDYEGKGDQVTNLNKDVQISGLSTEPIDYWSDNKLEKLFSKLSFLLMRLYEMDTAKR